MLYLSHTKISAYFQKMREKAIYRSLKSDNSLSELLCCTIGMLPHCLLLSCLNSLWRVHLVMASWPSKIRAFWSFLAFCSLWTCCGELARCWLALGMLRAWKTGTLCHFRCGGLIFAFFMISLVLACNFLHNLVE